MLRCIQYYTMFYTYDYTTTYVYDAWVCMRYVHLLLLCDAGPNDPFPLRAGYSSSARMRRLRRCCGTLAPGVAGTSRGSGSDIPPRMGRNRRGGQWRPRYRKGGGSRRGRRRLRESLHLIQRAAGCHSHRRFRHRRFRIRRFRIRNRCSRCSQRNPSCSYRNLIIGTSNAGG